MARKIYFSDFFDVDPKIVDEYGAFNVSLINDLPLFIDPFLLFDSDKAHYQHLHEGIITYIKFLRDVSVAGGLTQGNLDHWFLFREVKQNWLGFSTNGNGGTGLGRDFANALIEKLRSVFRDFGRETLTNGTHLEKLGLLGGVGRDHLSDLTTNLIRQFLLEYTETFAQLHLQPDLLREFRVEKVCFDYGRCRWLSKSFLLPFFQNDYLLLTPKDILTRDDAWISRGDLLDQFTQIRTALPDDQLRAEIEDYLLRRLKEDATGKDKREAAAAAIEAFPAVLDYYIRQKEEQAPEAHTVSDIKVKEAEEQFIFQLKSFIDERLAHSEFYELGTSFEESLKRVGFLKDVIENKDGYRIFYVNGKPVRREADLQVMFRLTWYATALDVSREVNNGRGPVDFKISKGARDKNLVEFKLASNTHLKRNLQNQVAIYEKANDTNQSIKVILYFNEHELERTLNILRELRLTGKRDIVLIDASAENKPSASKA